jgi:HK97 family phage major capsid protein
MKKYLEKLIERKRNEMAELQKRSDESNEINEVRSIGETLKALKAEIEEAETQLAKLDENDDDDDGAQRSVIPANAELRNAQVVGSFGATQAQAEEKDLQYRNAFMKHVLRNTPIPTELRANANTTTSDVAAAIPTHLVNQIIEKLDSVGMILPLITRTSYAAGVTIPTSSVKPVASWVAEGAGSDRQKKTTGKISFTYHKLRCEISMSMEVGTMALAAFEAKFVDNVVKAMVYAIENTVVNGTGEGQPTGILNGATATVTGAANYAKLCECEGAVKEEYETGAKWCMTKKTFMKFVGMVDQDGQPIARTNYGIGGKAERSLLGRDVVVAPYVPENKAFIFDFADYVLNTIYDMGISKKQDWDTEDLLTKAVMSVDGKPVDTGSLVLFEITPEA